MSVTQRATIAILIVAVLAVWGLGLRAALRARARADQELLVGSAATDTPSAEPTATTTSLATATPASSRESVSTTPTQATSPTPPPTPTASPTPVPSPPVTSTRQPSPVSSPRPTATLRPPALPSQPVGTPSIPQARRFLLVNQDEQVMRVYEDGIEIRTIAVSTGRPVANAFTPAWRGDVGRYWGSGLFLNTDLWSDHMWYLFPGARGSILIHSVPYTWDGNLKIYDQPDVLGTEPISHGCVRISPEDAEWLENWDPVGVPIEITPWSGEIGPPDESL